MHFHKFALDVTTAEEKTDILYPADKANVYKVKDLLRMSNLALDTVKANGAVLQVLELDHSASAKL